jgi:hypothetical protein
MNIEANRAHSPVREFFQSPQVQRSLKITAVALAALAVIGAVAATSVVLAIPLLALAAAPVAIGAIALSIILAKRSKPIPAPQVQDPETIFPVTEPVELPATQKTNTKEEELNQILRNLDIQREQEIKRNQEWIQSYDRGIAAVDRFMEHYNLHAPVLFQIPPQYILTHEELIKLFQGRILLLEQMIVAFESDDVEPEVNKDQLNSLKSTIDELPNLTNNFDKETLLAWTDTFNKFQELRNILRNQALIIDIHKKSANIVLHINNKVNKNILPIFVLLISRHLLKADLKKATNLTVSIPKNDEYTEVKEHLILKIAEAHLQAGQKKEALNVISFSRNPAEAKRAFEAQLNAN